MTEPSIGTLHAEEGIAHGGKVGNYAVDSVLRPVR